jgi:hypothetical protein
MPTNLSPQIINAAILGFTEQKRLIDHQIAELRAMLPGSSTEPAATPEAPPIKRRKFSAAARRRMKEAQQLRWAKIRGQSEPSSSPATTTESSKPKRKLSKAGRAAFNSAKAKPPVVAKKATAKKAVAKKKLSPARKAALVANLAKAREAKAAKAMAAAG